MPVPTAGFKLDGAALAPNQPPRQVGADTEAILQSLGYTADEIATLRTVSCERESCSEVDH